VIGWILTSDSARSFIKTSKVGKSAAVAGIVIMALAYLLLTLRMTHVMRHLGRELAALDYFPPAYYTFRVMAPRVVLANTAIAIAPAAVAVALLLFGIT
jgi:hypothetical protein